MIVLLDELQVVVSQERGTRKGEAVMSSLDASLEGERKSTCDSNANSLSHTDDIIEIILLVGGLY